MTESEKAKAYEEALERAKKLYNEAKANDYTSDMEDYETIFPELKESEDERIRKMCITYLDRVYHYCSFADDLKNIEKCIAWLEKQGKHQQLYIRFGDIPSNEKSKIYRGEKEIGTENGVSVYPAFKSTNGDIVLGLNLPITKTTLHTQQHLLEYDNRPCYLVTGDYVGKDTDGQILISNVNIIEKIDNYRVKTEKQGDTTSDTMYEAKAGDSISANGKPFDYEKATITQKDYAHRDYNEIDPNLGIPDWVLMSRKNPVDKVEPKFKVGDMVCKKKDNSFCATINSITDTVYLCDVFDSDGDYDDDYAFLISEQDEYELVAKKIGDEIEIPFGAKDSELQEETYYIPKGFHAEIDDDKVVIKKGEKPATWSEEDEEMTEDLIKGCISAEKAHHFVHTSKEIADWLKSLKERNTWKPSKKQMETLEYYMHTLLATEHKEVLFGLYNDLKKL